MSQHHGVIHGADRKEKAPVLGELSFPSLAESMAPTFASWMPLCVRFRAIMLVCSYAKETEGFQEVKSKPSARSDASAPSQPQFVECPQLNAVY